MIRVALHRSIYPRNVGMCARAMANMGVQDLIAVGPRCDLKHEEAKQGAAHAQEILRNVRIYQDSQDFLKHEGDGIRIALSGRDGRLKRPNDLTEALKRISEQELLQPDTPIYLMFGPEDDGLSNEEMELCHHICRLPTYGEITSLNLSHAVLLTLYMTQSARLVTAPQPSISDPRRRPAYYPAQTIKSWLEALGFDLSARRVSIEKTLNRILLSRCPNEEELRIIDMVLQQTVRKLKNQQS